MFAFSAENERILVMKYGEKSCKLIITSVAKTDEGIWRGVVTLAFRRNALQHHNYNVSILVQGKLYVVENWMIRMILSHITELWCESSRFNFLI